jgi:hypothetical protein
VDALARRPRAWSIGGPTARHPTLSRRGLARAVLARRVRVRPRVLVWAKVFRLLPRRVCFTGCLRCRWPRRVSREQGLRARAAALAAELPPLTSLAGGGGGHDRRAARRPQRSGASGVTLSRPCCRHPSSWYRRHQEDEDCPAARTCSPGGQPDRRKIPGHHKLVLTIEAARAAGPVLAAYLSAHSAMINGSSPARL